jgi:hypothetical protein
MSRFAQLPRPSFGQRIGPDEKAAGVMIARGLARRQAMIRQAAAMVEYLPGPGEAVHGLIVARFDLLHLVVVLLQRLGPCRALRLATLSFNARNLVELVGILDAPNPPKLTLLASEFFRAHNTELWEEAVEELRDGGARLAAARSHAKVVTLDFASGIKLTLEGSANLRANGNREQFALIHDDAVHDWHAAWIDDLVTQHEGDDHGEGE